MNWKFWQKQKAPDYDGNMLFRLAQARNNAYSIYSEFRNENPRIAKQAIYLHADIVRAYKTEQKRVFKEGK